MRAKKIDLVLGACRGYSFNDIRYFAQSLRQTGFEGEARLFFPSLTPQDRRSLKRFGVKCVFFSDRYPFLRGFDAVARKVLPPREYAFSYFKGVFAGANGVYYQRFLLYYLYLVKYAAAYDKVLLADVGDVVFQKDPFAFPFRDDTLYCFQERDTATLGSTYWTRAWMRAGFGKKAASGIRDKTVVCSGLVLGSVACVLDYLQKMLGAFESARVLIPRGDQGVHNYLIYRGILSGVSLLTNESGPAIHLALLRPEDVRLTKQGLVKNKAGKVVSVVHQYNRHPALADLIRQRYGANDAVRT